MRYHYTPEEAQALLSVPPIQPARYDTIGECEVCGEDFDKKKRSQKYCSPECRRKVKQEYDLKRWHEVGDAKRRERVEEAQELEEMYGELDPANATGDAHLNLIYAILLNARENDDEDAIQDLEPLLQVARRAVYGRSTGYVT